MRNIKFIEIASDLGAGTHGASMGMNALRMADEKMQYGIFAGIDSERIMPALFEHPHIEYKFAKNVDRILNVHKAAVEEIVRTLDQDGFPLILSGDHSNAIAGMSALKKQHPNKRLGVIWIDAHADLHTPFTTPSGNVHGMPLGAALNLISDKIGDNEPTETEVAFWEEIRTLGGPAPQITPQDLVLIGIRDLEKEEWKIVENNNIKYISVDEVTSSGSKKIVSETLSYLADCDMIYVSFDVDSLDKKIVPGTGTPVDLGFSVVQAEQLLKAFWASDKLAALEFSEINPLLDIKNQTAEVSAYLLNQIINS